MINSLQICDISSREKVWERHSIPFVATLIVLLMRLKNRRHEQKVTLQVSLTLQSDEDLV